MKSQPRRAPEFVAIHLVDAETGRYFQSPGEWVEDRRHATGFTSGEEAIGLAYESNLKRVELLLAFLLPAYREVRMPLALG